jgi:ABC-type branched-subunit amino acid transport system substrate-binding protein
VQGSGITIVEDKSYPLGVKDLAPVLRSIKDKAPDAFVGLTYPPDTILVSRQSKEIGFNPKFFYASVGTAFQLYRNVMQAGAEGVLGMGSWNTKTSAGAKAYFDAHVKKFGAQKEPDRWASGACWASLEILTNAVAKVGLDRKAIRDYVAGHRAQHHPRQDQVRRQRERRHAGQRRPVAEGRVRGRLAEGDRDRTARSRQARLGVRIAGCRPAPGSS